MKTLPQAGCRTALVEAALEVCLGARLYLVNGSNGGLNCTLCCVLSGITLLLEREIITACSAFTLASTSKPLSIPIG